MTPRQPNHHHKNHMSDVGIGIQIEQARHEGNAIQHQTGVLFDRSIEHGPHPNTHHRGLRDEAFDNRVCTGRGRRQALVRIEGRTMNRWHEIRRKHHPHDLADRIGRKNAPDPQTQCHFQGNRCLSRPGRPANEDQYRLLRFLVLSPHEVALSGSQIETLQQYLVGAPSQIRSLDGMHPFAPQIQFDLVSDVEGIVGINRRCEQRL